MKQEDLDTKGMCADRPATAILIATAILQSQYTPQLLSKTHGRVNVS